MDRAGFAAARRKAGAVPICCVSPDNLADTLSRLGRTQESWAKANRFSARSGDILILPAAGGKMAGVLFGGGAPGGDAFGSGKLPRALPAATYAVSGDCADPFAFAMGWGLGAYRFSDYVKGAKNCGSPRLVVPPALRRSDLERQIEGVFLARDLINLPANDLGPGELEARCRSLAKAHGARIGVTKGDALLKKNFPMIHAVGRASDRAPRLIDMTWGKAGAAKVTLVGKGVCFDTGGLNLKPGKSMALMKKDMGGAAHVLGLAAMIMSAGLKVRLRVLIPAVDNNVSANAYRPGDILRSRRGLSVEIGNTDAEGRLVLADALTLGDEEAPDLLINMATLTGAARVALGPDLPPFFTDDDALADAIAAHAVSANDPLWRLPFWPAYDRWLESKIADVNHITDSGFAGSMTAALFLRRFVRQTKRFVHFDIFGWCPREKPSCVVGGEAQGIRALYGLIAERYGA